MKPVAQEEADKALAAARAWAKAEVRGYLDACKKHRLGPPHPSVKGALQVIWCRPATDEQELDGTDDKSLIEQAYRAQRPAAAKAVKPAQAQQPDGLL